MKKTTILIFIFILLGIISYAQNDTMYIMKNGVVVRRYNIQIDIDSMVYYNPPQTSQIVLPLSGTFTDIRDGNNYNWVTIGNQIWMAENLKYLPSVVGPNTSSSILPLYYVYGNYGTNVTEAKTMQNYNTCGVLYNWPAALAGSYSSSANPSGVQGVCPSGWHLPSDAEWTQLINYLDGLLAAGGKLKAIGTFQEGNSIWQSPNTGATNETGFSALPCGTTSFSDIQIAGHYCYWWSATLNGYSKAWIYRLCYDWNLVLRDDFVFENGFSVRCVKN